MKHTEARIQKLFFEKFCKSALVVPNLYFRNSRFESDIVVIQKTGLSYEYEIKCSKADFRSEFTTRSKMLKHKYISPYSIGRHRPNFYSFVSPPDIIALEDIKIDEYGLFHITDGFYIKKIRRPKRLHDNRVTSDEYYNLARKMMYKLFTHSDKFKIRKSVLDRPGR